MPASAASVHELLRARGATVATAESLTGGRLAAMLTSVPGSSETFVGGVVAYATELKVSLLGVPPGVVERYGVVSAECARAMAEGARRATGATYAVSTTGVAGPGPQDGIPAGTVHVGVAGPGATTAVALELVGDRERGPRAHLWRGVVGAFRDPHGGRNHPRVALAPNTRKDSRMVLFRRLLGDVLRDQRMRRGMTLREVSAEARVSLGYISEIERGQKEASSELLASLCTALEVPLSDVLREVSDAVAVEEAAVAALAATPMIVSSRRRGGDVVASAA